MPGNSKKTYLTVRSLVDDLDQAEGIMALHNAIENFLISVKWNRYPEYKQP